ncbi:MAG: aldo/keto reductase [Planctomycetaceae bacterium]
MQTSNWNGLSLSRMMLGTVQFGLPYGVANHTGQPSYDEVVRIVTAAYEGGVNCFDTAAAYGTSEEVLGNALHELRLADKVTVVTKVFPLTAPELAAPALAFRAIERSIENSRQKLRLDCLPIVLFHRETDAAHMEGLARLRDRGWLKFYGVSCDNFAGPAKEFAASTDALQIPANIVDRRHLQSDFFEVATSNNVAIFVRSVYLQGLLVMPEHDIPDSLREILPARHTLDRIAQQAGLSLQELAVRFILSQSGVTSVLVGVESVSQVTDNLALFNGQPLPDDVLTQLQRLNCDLPESLITPSQWPSRVSR